MDGVRSIVERFTGAVQLEKQVNAIEKAVDQWSDMAFDLAKTMIETVCKTVLNDCGVPFSNDDDLPQLLKTALTHLQLYPTGVASGSATQDRFKKTLNGLGTVVQGLCELRSGHGMAGHGQDAYATSMERCQAEFAARAADAVVCFLWNAHKNYPRVAAVNRLRLEDNQDFNDWMDELHDELRIFEVSYLASEVLFTVDMEAYRDALADYRSQPPENNQDANEADKGVAQPAEKPEAVEAAEQARP